MRALALFALLLAGCSGSDSTRASKSGAAGQGQETPRAAAAQMNLPDPGAGSGGTGGGTSSTMLLATPAVDPNSVIHVRTPVVRKPPIDPGLSRLPGYQASLNIVNTVSPESNSLARGFQLFGQACAPCHGEDLHGQPAMESEKLRDLTHSKEYRFGSTDQALYRTLVYGIPKSTMGNYKHVFKPEQVWELINYMKSKRID